MKTLLPLLLVALPSAGCDRTPAAEERDVAEELDEAEPAVDLAEPSSAPAAPSPDLSDPRDGMTLRLPEPGTSRERVFAVHPECADERALTEDGCRFHGWIRPLSQHCENGCTWWTYRFEEDALASAELERAEWDVDAEYAARFTAEARVVADELGRRLHSEPSVETLGEWAAVEASEDGAPRVLERRTWILPDRRVVWSVSADPGHHPGILLRVRQSPASP